MSQTRWIDVARVADTCARRVRVYQRTFGVIHGPFVMAGNLMPRATVMETRIGDDPRPLWLRRSTTDIVVYDQVVTRGEYEFGVPQDAKTILDVGANAGITSAWYASRYPGCQVIAVEPEERNYAMLLENAASRPEITPVRAALSPSSGMVRAINPDAPAWAYQYRDFSNRRSDDSMLHLTGTGVRAMTVAELIDDYSLDRIDLLKLDIEGSERDVFEGDVTFLAHVGAIAIELHDRFRPGCSRAFFRAVADFPYETWNGNTVLVARDP
jgi:FkbM family methyltransferase